MKGVGLILDFPRVDTAPALLGAALIFFAYINAWGVRWYAEDGSYKLFGRFTMITRIALCLVGVILIALAVSESAS